jgi:hypothetical protein
MNGGACCATVTSYEGFETTIQQTFQKFVEKGKIDITPNVKPPAIPENL